MRKHYSIRSAFTLVEIMIVVAIIGLLAAIAIPSFVRAREVAQRTVCINNLKAIEGSKSTWALAQNRSSSDTPTDADLFGLTSYIPSKPSCPAGGAYTLNQVDVKPSCTIGAHTF